MNEPIQFFDLVQTPGGLGRVQGRVTRRGWPDRVIVTHAIAPAGAPCAIPHLTAYPIDQVRKYQPLIPHTQRRSA